MVRKSWSQRLREWRQRNEEEYAKAVLSPPQHTTLLQAVPHHGVILVMGGKGMGKSALAHDIAEKRHNRKHSAAVLHLPKIPPNLKGAIQRRLPPWMKVVTSMDDWPKKATVIYDEASQGAHARRTQSGEAVELDNLMGISRQRDQLIIFISHHSRKLDPNVIRDVDRIAWKGPTYAHAIFERDELTDFVMKALQWFHALNTDKKKWKSTLIMDFHNFVFSEFTNGVPSYWSEKLSALFEDIKIAPRASGKGGKRGKRD